jgi:hypothetical protein
MSQKKMVKIKSVPLGETTTEKLLISLLSMHGFDIKPTYFTFTSSVRKALGSR